MTKEEYMRLLLEIEQSEQIEQENDLEWIPSEPIVKEKINKYKGAKVIDLTNKNSDQIKVELHNATNFIVDKFKIQIYNYGVVPDDSMKLSLRIFEEKYKTHSGMPCNIDFVLAIETDNRFERASWKNKFNHTWGSGLSFDELFDIVRWLQKINKFAYFT